MNPNSKRFASIRDVAKLAGVSTATVSRVINNPNVTSEKTREKVLKAIRECGYTPSSATLFTGISKTIALFVLDISNPFYTSLMKHLNRIAFENEYNLIICETEDSFQKERQYYHYCKSNRACGIIYTAGSTRKNFELDTQNPIPLVLIDRAQFEDFSSYSLKSDNEKALQLLVNYLYRLNHRRIGFIGGPPAVQSVQERYQGFLKYMQLHNLPIIEEYIKFGTFEEITGVRYFDYFYSLSAPPTAIIAASDQIAHGFIMRANALGVNIPGEFSICGIDAVDEHFYPKITSVKQDTRLLAQTAFNFIKNVQQVPPPVSQIIDVSFSVGQTCRKIHVSQTGY